MARDGQKKTEVLVKLGKVDSHVTPEKDTLEVFTSGELTLTWDNSYSYWTDKELTYALHTEDYEEDMFLDDGAVDSEEPAES